jgi:hypothetical protein
LEAEEESEEDESSDEKWMSLKKKQKRAKKEPTMESSPSFHLLSADRTHVICASKSRRDSFYV